MIGSFAAPQEVVVRHSPDVEPFVSTPKSTTFAKYAVANKDEELLVVSVHIINFETTGAFKRHLDQIKGVISQHSGPVLLAGDFNTWNASRKNYLDFVAKNLNLKEAEYINGNARLSFKGHFLDHVYSRGLNLGKVEVKPESQGSDHRPLLVEFSVL
jgi:endonuclease/exonuclease/phosphatase (EEP) superfamily protein YafD